MLVAFSGTLLLAPAAESQCVGTTAARPILFVPGILENSTAWGNEIPGDVVTTGIRSYVVSEISGTSGYSNITPYDLYYDGSQVRLALVPPGDPTADPIASNANIPGDARNFAISFYGWSFEGASGPDEFDPQTVAQISILTKAYELSQVLQAIARLTCVQDAIVIAHSMGALDVRAYVEGLGSTVLCEKTLTCYAPGSLQYTGEVGHLITLDGTNAGADIAGPLSFLGELIGLNLLNVNELETGSMVVQSLNYHEYYIDNAGDDVKAQPVPSNLGIDAVISYYSAFPTPCALNASLSCNWDLVVPTDSQSIQQPLYCQDCPGINDFSLYYSATDPTIVFDPNCLFVFENLLQIPGVLHLLPCLGDTHENPFEQIWNLVYQQVAPYTAGQLTSINIQTTYNGAPYTGPISLTLSYGQTNLLTLTTPQAALSGASAPPGTEAYSLMVSSGGPIGASYSVQAANANATSCFASINGVATSQSSCYLSPGNWALSFVVSFNSGTIPAPMVTTQQANGLSGDGSTIQGSVNANGANATAWFEWGQTNALGNSTPVQSITAGTISANFSYVQGGLESGTTYYYRADASNGQTTVYGDVLPFATLGTLPSPILLTPANSCTGASTSPTFTWSTVPEATSYRLLIATNLEALPTDPTLGSCGVGCVLDVTPTGTSYTPPAGVLSAGTTYYWEVHARSPLQFGTWSSPPYSFTTAAPGLASVSISPSTIVGGSPATVYVTLNGPAPAGGAVVSLSPSALSVFPAPSSIPVPAGSTSASVSVTSGLVPESNTITETASYGGSTASAAVTVTPSSSSVFLQSLTITPSSIAGGYQAQGNVFLTGPAPAGGATINVSSNNVYFAQVPSTATVQPGYTSVTFPISTSFTSGSVGATINASYNNTMFGATVTVLPVVAAGLTFYPSTVAAGSPAQFTVNLNGPAPAGTSVSLLSSAPSVLQVQGSVPVPTGATSIIVVGTTSGVGSQTSVTVTATYNGGSAQGSVTLIPLTLISFGVNPNNVTGGSSVTGTVWLSDIAPAGGLNVSISATSSLVQYPAKVNVPQGASSASFTATTSAVTSVYNVIVSASYGGISYNLTLTIVPPLPYLASLSLSPGTVIAGSVATATVTLTAPAPPGGIGVSLGTSFGQVANAPPGLGVPEGATSATFNVPTSPINFITPVAISANYNGTSQVSILTVVPPGTPLSPSSLILGPTVVTGGSPSSATVTLTGPAPSGGAVVSLSSDNPSVQVTPILTVPGGLNSAVIQATTPSVSAVSTATIKATYNGVSQSSLLTIVPPGGQPDGNPVPFLIPPLSPVSQAPGEGGLSLALRGTGFTPGAQAYWNSIAVPTTYVDGNQLQAVVPQADVQGNGSAIVIVKNPGSPGTASNGLPEHLTFPTPLPSFSTASLTASGQPMAVLTADLNGDGKPDLIVNNGTSGLSVFLGNGDGTFAPELLLQASPASSTAVGDFNGDGKPDIVTAGNNTSTGAIRLYLGNGDGTFTEAADTQFFNENTWETSLAVGDFNGDGKLDVVVVADEGPSQAYVLLGNGDGTFGLPMSVGSFDEPFDAAVSDFNGDGVLDLAVLDTGTSSVAILFGNGDGTFQPQLEYPAGGYPYALVVADFNGDGAPDIAIADSGPVGGSSSGTAILLNDGNGSFAPPVNYATGTEDYFLSTDDVNGDGNLDLVVSQTYPSFQTLIFLGNGNGTFNAVPVVVPSGGPDMFYNAVTDLNGDGAPDLILTRQLTGAGNISVLLQSIAPILQVAPATLSYTWRQGGGPLSSSLTISNAGTGAAAWTAAASQPWLSLSQTTGTAPWTVTVSANPLGLGPGTYSGTITVSAPGVSNSLLTLPVSLTVNPALVVVSLLTFNPSSVVGPGTLAGIVTLNGPAPSTGTVVAISSNSSIVQTPAAVTVLAGTLSASFLATASAASSQTVATLTAACNGVTTNAAVTIQPGTTSVTTTTLTVSPNPATFGQNVTLTAAVSPSRATGSVTFMDGTAALGSASLTAGVANLAVSTLVFGPHSLIAVYSGSATYGSSIGTIALQVATCASLPTAPIYFDSDSGQAQVAVYASGSCSWTASGDSPWIGVTPPSGSGNGMLATNVGPYAGAADQSGNVDVAVAGQGMSAVSVTQRFTSQVFADTTPGYYDFDAVNLLSIEGVTNGCSATDFCPTEDIIRSQMAVFIVRSILHTDDFTYSPLPWFADVPVGSFGFQWIQKMYELGITNGCAVNLFCPDEQVTRAQMAVFLIRMRYGATYVFDYPSTPYFTDVTPSTFGWSWIQRMKEDNITSGCAATTYCPDNPVTRGDMATFVMHGAFNELLPSEDPVLASISPTTIVHGGAPSTYTITGVDTHFVNGVTTLGTLAGISVGTVTVVNSTTLTVQLTAASDAALDPLSPLAITGTPPGNEEAVLPNGLTVQ